MGSNKAVHLMFLSGGLVLFFLTMWTADWVWGYFARSPNDFALNGIAAAIALTVGIAAYRNDRLYSLAHDVANELSKVTWPTGKETKAATLVVIITVIIAAVILGSFDALWAWITKQIYG